MRRPTWSAALLTAVEELRLDNPMWGKAKIAVLLAREGISVSASTVGRILAHLVARGGVQPVPVLRRKPGSRRFRFTGNQRYARRLPKGHKPRRPGELVQIDTLFVNVRPNRAIKHFTAYDPVAKWTAGHVASSATAAAAKRLLDKLIETAPFKIEDIQVDGGSEFRAVFEDECQRRGLTLFVLPPKRPQLNGAVERAQSTWRYEFSACYDLPHRLEQLNPFVNAFAHRYNTIRPHGALDGMTLLECLNTISDGAQPSHMC